MAENIVRVEVTPRRGEGMRDVRGDSIRRQLATDYSIEFNQVRSIVGFLISSNVSEQQITTRVDDLFADPVIEISKIGESILTDEQHFPDEPDHSITIGFKPGVTDNPGKAALDGLFMLFPEAGISADISTYITYAFFDGPPNVDSTWLANKLHNSLIERAIISNSGSPHPSIDYSLLEETQYLPPSIINLEIADEELIELSNTGLLALNLKEMTTIRDHYRDSEIRAAREKVRINVDAPTDVELECLAQTWSEHCKHKIFAAKIHHIDDETGEDCIIDSLFKI